MKRLLVTHHPTSEHQCTTQWFDSQSNLIDSNSQPFLLTSLGLIKAYDFLSSIFKQAINQFFAFTKFTKK